MAEKSVHAHNVIVWKRVQHGLVFRYLRKPRLIVMAKWDATKNSLFHLLNKWAQGCDSIAATSDITHALMRAAGREELWKRAHSMKSKPLFLFVFSMHMLRGHNAGLCLEWAWSSHLVLSAMLHVHVPSWKGWLWPSHCFPSVCHEAATSCF